jgi:hypothetical protein
MSSNHLLLHIRALAELAAELDERDNDPDLTAELREQEAARRTLEEFDRG